MICKKPEDKKCGAALIEGCHFIRKVAEKATKGSSCSISCYLRQCYTNKKNEDMRNILLMLIYRNKDYPKLKKRIAKYHKIYKKEIDSPFIENLINKNDYLTKAGVANYLKYYCKESGCKPGICSSNFLESGRVDDFSKKSN